MTEFYEKNHAEYFDSTVNIDPSSFLTPLLQYLNPGAKILDVGCGSGRDLLWFAEKGFDAIGLERSPSLARLARVHSKRPVIEADFGMYDFSHLNCDAVVLVGALVHVTREDLPQILEAISICLNPNGYMLVTMKEGHGIRHFSDGRIFTLWQREDLEEIFSKIGFEIKDFDRKTSKIRQDDVWLGYVLRRINEQRA